MSKMDIKKVANSEAFKNLELPARMQNEVVTWLHKFCHVDGEDLIIHTYEGQEIRLKIDASQFTDPETNEPYRSTYPLAKDITAGLYACMRIMISRAIAQTHGEDSPTSGWYPSEDGESHYGYDYINWETEE